MSIIAVQTSMLRNTTYRGLGQSLTGRWALLLLHQLDPFPLRHDRRVNVRIIWKGDVIDFRFRIFRLLTDTRWIMLETDHLDVSKTKQERYREIESSLGIRDGEFEHIRHVEKVFLRFTAIGLHKSDIKVVPVLARKRTQTSMRFAVDKMLDAWLWEILQVFAMLLFGL